MLCLEDAQAERGMQSWKEAKQRGSQRVRWRRAVIIGSKKTRDAVITESKRIKATITESERKNLQSLRSIERAEITKIR